MPIGLSVLVVFRDSSNPLTASFAKSLLYCISSIVALSERSADPPCGLSFIMVTYTLLPFISLIAIAESTGK
jgi:hypothetical protein